ncbi:MAG TPA: esterase-like activity of phytase family protein, partial [Candidatus Polarisedimenticolia bacterium]|nr:esterase-like activity of phytase family protein [Candidatus Polarisedimenticolia bacterium]
ATAPAAPAGGDPAGEAARHAPCSTLLTSLWRDELSNPARARVDQVSGVTEPSDLLFVDGLLYTVSDSFRDIYRLSFDGPGGSVRRSEAWSIAGLPVGVDLEAMGRLPSGEVLLASETNGAIFVLSPFPRHACAAWRTEVDGGCFIGRSNCGIEALAVLPDGRLLVAKERDPRGAWLFDLPAAPCAGTTLTGRTYLKLPDEVGPDISAATYDPLSDHILLVARSRQRVLEFEVPPRTPGDTSPRALQLVGSFSFAAAENTLDYPGLDFHQVEGIAVDADRVLYLVVDNNERISRAFGNRRPALLRFFPVEDRACPR